MAILGRRAKNQHEILATPQKKEAANGGLRYSESMGSCGQTPQLAKRDIQYRPVQSPIKSTGAVHSSKNTSSARGPMRS